ncbi:MAG: type II toxin-antitoxin system RelE/ParE family toxin [Bryobacteraceae bacterium]|nr:type II toxin-antitoxin system RelE/ParE family toxin [Bryobacteraceae bacterium]
MKRILFSAEAKSDIRDIPQHIAMNILAAIHRLAEHGIGDVKELRGEAGDKRLRVGDYRVRFTEEHPQTLRIHAVRNRKDAYR